MKNNISLLVGLKNNLDYNKNFYQTTRELYPDVEICFVSYGSTDGTHEWLNTLNDINVKYFYADRQKTFSDTFNKAAEIATKDYVAYLHNDIVLAPGFIENLEKHVSPDNIVAYTTIEPPIFAGHERPGKLIYDLGTELETFDKYKLYEYVDSVKDTYLDRTEPGITFFMCMPKDRLLEIGGMDNLYNPMFCEDDDLIRRWNLLGMNCFTALDAICYHFVSKTSRFSDEYQNKTQQIEIKSNRNYIRKWGSRTCPVKYNIAYVVKNCTPNLLPVLEPFCDRLYVDDHYGTMITNYIESEQPNTKFDLLTRVLNTNLNDPANENDIIVEFDANNVTNDNIYILQQLPDILYDQGEPGKFTIEAFTLDVTELIEYQKDLVQLT